MGQNETLILAFQISATYLPFYIIPEKIHISLSFPEFVLIYSTVSSINRISVICIEAQCIFTS